MILKRQKKRPIHHELWESLWPSMGWKRTLRYFKYRLLRLNDNPRKVARGIASGVSISFVPIPFTHFIQAGILAYLIRGNIFAALLSTWVGNPWTFPPMWLLSYDVGVWTFDRLGWRTPDFPVNFTFDDFWHVLTTDPLPLMLPWVTGGYLLMLISWFATYYAVRPLIAKAQHDRAARRRARHGGGHHGSQGHDHGSSGKTGTRL